MATAIDLLTEQFTESSAKILKVLDGIGDDEFFWEPCAGCWTVHRRSEPRAASVAESGEWVIDYENPEPDPAPVTAIAWRTVHVAAVNYLYWHYAFGPATATFDLEMPGNAADAVAWLAASQQLVMQALQSLDDEGLDQPRLTNWGEKLPTRRIFTTLITE